MYPSTPTWLLWEELDAYEALENPTRGQQQQARNHLAEIARREGHWGCGTRAGWLRHYDRGERPCLPCELFDMLRQDTKRRRYARQDAKRSAPAKARRKAQRASMIEHALAWQAFLAAERRGQP